MAPSNPDCWYTNSAGLKYEELACVYPSLGKILPKFDLEYDPIPIRDRMVELTPWVPLGACCLYGLLIVLGQAYFSKRPAWDMRTALQWWNFGLSVFSTIGFLRTLPYILHQLIMYPTWEDVFCRDPETTYGSGSTGLWVQLFILSKFPELVDTFFIVVHKKKLIFLHWYHHVTVLLYCWHAYVTKAPPGIFFVVMNYGVHAIMYAYYWGMAITSTNKTKNNSNTTNKDATAAGASAKPVKSPWRKRLSSFGWIITSLQISQMVMGVIITTLSFYYFSKNNSSDTSSCAISSENNTAAFVMYGSYLLLFVQFFVERYLSSSLKKKKKKDGESGDNLAKKNQ